MLIVRVRNYTLCVQTHADELICALETSLGGSISVLKILYPRGFTECLFDYDL